MAVNLLAIESSCDDTSASVLQDGIVLSNVVANQDVHQLYGGVVPEVASRAHQENILPVVDAALKKAGIAKKDLNGIAFTRGPGLIGSLIVGVSFAKGLALSLDIPLIEVNHMNAHVLAHFAEDPKPSFPFLCLTVSGGHTQIVKVDAFDKMTVLGKTIDDAAGEAFDKTGKLLGLPYPAGPIIDKKAKLGQPLYKFPKPKVGELDFSFSGLKTSIRYFLQKEREKNINFIEENINDICRSVQDRIVSVLIDKLITAAEQTGIKEIAIAGGVSANSALRASIEEEGKKRDWKTYIPAFQFCTDNAGMIAVAGYYKYLAGEFVGQDIAASARIK